MNESELARHRTQMGHAAAALAAGEGMDSCVATAEQWQIYVNARSAQFSS
jgi:hypothetical protein